MYRFDLAEAYLRRGIDYCIERDLDHARRYQMSWLALVQLYGGRWSESTATAHAVLADARSSAVARMMALVALGRVRARRGDPDVWEALDAARELAGRSGTLQRVAPMRAARAEAAWLEGRPQAAAAEAVEGLELALRKRHAWFASELLFWKCRAEGTLLASVPGFCVGNPFALEVAGRQLQAAARWEELGCPYEAARALAAADEAAQRGALPALEGMGARPLAERLRRDLRAAGVRGLARGPRAAKPGLPAGLSAKEGEVLRLLCEGLRNKEIAERLHRSVRTIDHHVAAVFAKLGAANRAEAVSAAHRLGMAGEPK